MRLLVLTDADSAAMLRGDAGVRAGLAQPPGGVAQAEVLEHVRRLAERLHVGGYIGGHWMMVVNDEVVGLCGIKAPPDTNGVVEIGYGVAASRRRRGHATAAIRALVGAARSDAALRTIVAATRVDNIASQRVLENNQFVRAGTRADPEDGNVLLWRIEV